MLGFVWHRFKGNKENCQYLNNFYLVSNGYLNMF